MKHKSEGRLKGKVAVVTGSARGFGKGIAELLAEEGALLAITDIDKKGAESVAEALCNKHGKRSAIAVCVDISDEDSVKTMVDEVIKQLQRIDLFVANAGVLRAGSVKTMELQDWKSVTDVNYTGYFLCVKHVSRAMAKQNAGDPKAWTDIVQINSKSGLEGSSRNAAYAGSKFGAIGLTQSFAKELIEDRIKVNSICPGNYFEGPLWNDPVDGLFRQYLEAGKVPGAQSIADVRKHYESLVPMGRGCAPEDVAKAILYCIEQKYETGQAIPVTGGQIMLK